MFMLVISTVHLIATHLFNDKLEEKRKSTNILKTYLETT
jgi:hypothetical protein